MSGPAVVLAVVDGFGDKQQPGLSSAEQRSWWFDSWFFPINVSKHLQTVNVLICGREQFFFFQAACAPNSSPTRTRSCYASVWVTIVSAWQVTSTSAYDWLRSAVSHITSCWLTPVFNHVTCCMLLCSCVCHLQRRRGLDSDISQTDRGDLPASHQIRSEPKPQSHLITSHYIKLSHGDISEKKRSSGQSRPDKIIRWSG